MVSHTFPRLPSMAANSKGGWFGKQFWIVAPNMHIAHDQMQWTGDAVC